MFYCEDCRVKNDWPESFARSKGNCECCGDRADCFDTPSSRLPKKPEPEIIPISNTSRDYWECERCKISSIHPSRIIPCPRGGCEAKVTGKITTTIVLTKNQ